MERQKPIRTIVLDSGPIIKNAPAVSSLLKQAESLTTIPAVIAEIRDPATRSRLETTLLPFLTIRQPNPNSVKLVADFARRTGDLPVLSKPDIEVLALSYELECELNGGDWRLRSTPGQKGTNGPPPAKANEQNEKSEGATATAETEHVSNTADVGELAAETSTLSVNEGNAVNPTSATEGLVQLSPTEPSALEPTSSVGEAIKKENQDHQASVNGDPTTAASTTSGNELRETPPAPQAAIVTEPLLRQDGEDEHTQPSEDSDSEGWITPSNVKRKQLKEADEATTGNPQQHMQVATITTDFAMQNVLLQMNLNLLSGNLQRVKNIKTFVLRCHGCFWTSRRMEKQFCDRCGQPNLTKVTCSTNSKGEFKLHLKKNMQWNHRGEKYSIPKPVSGSANSRVKGGGKGGWGNELILTEDQKEYQRALTQEKKQVQRDLMDEDYLPSILSGDRARTGGRIKVGAGRNVNSRKR